MQTHQTKRNKFINNYITETQKSLLMKGPSFVPTPSDVN